MVISTDLDISHGTNPNAISKNLHLVKNYPYHPWDGRYIYQLIYHNNQPNVGRYTSPMDCMGYTISHPFSLVR